MEKKNYYGYWLHSLLKGKRCDDYIELAGKREKELDEKESEISSILKVMRTDKNCLFLFSDYFWSQVKIPYSVFVECAIWYFDLWAKELFKYRDIQVEGMDAYIAVFIPQYERLLVLKWKSDQEEFVMFDSIPFDNNPHLKKHLELDSGDQFVICVKNSMKAESCMNSSSQHNHTRSN